MPIYRVMGTRGWLVLSIALALVVFGSSGSAHAVTLDEARRHPAVAESLAEVPNVPFAISGGDAETPSNMALDPALDGAFAVSTGRLRDGYGNPLEQLPSLMQAVTFDGRVFIPSGVGSYGMLSVPAGAETDVMRVGDDLFSSVGVSLIGRNDAEGVALKGAAFYESVLPSTSQMLVLTPDGIKEWLLLDDESAGTLFAYRLQLPAGASAAESDGTIRVFSASHEVLLEIAAPYAIDGAGHAYDVNLRLVNETTFEVEVDGDLDNVQWPLAIDPIFKRPGPSSGLTDVDGFLQVNFCGQLSNEGDDFHPDEEPDEKFPCNNATNGGSLSAEPGGHFERIESTTLGLGIRAKENTPAGAEAAVRVVPARPPDWGSSLAASVVESSLRTTRSPVPFGTQELRSAST
jgi:hypothetical protein